MDADMQEKLVFIHMPKTAGMSVREMLRSYAPDARVFYYDRFAMSGQDGIDIRRHLEQFDVFVGHMRWHMIDLIPDPKKIVVFLRDPVWRLLSHYNFLRTFAEGSQAMRQTSYVRLAKNLPLAQFLTSGDVGMREHFDNLYTRVLVGPDHMSDDRTSFRSGRGHALRLARNNLDKAWFVGISELFPHCMARLFHLLGMEAPVAEIRTNRTADNIRTVHTLSTGEVTDVYETVYEPWAYLSEESADAVAAFTGLDQALYDHALATRGYAEFFPPASGERPAGAFVPDTDFGLLREASRVRGQARRIRDARLALDRLAYMEKIRQLEGALHARDRMIDEVSRLVQPQKVVIG